MFPEYSVESRTDCLGQPRGHCLELHCHMPGWFVLPWAQEVRGSQDRRYGESASLHIPWMGCCNAPQCPSSSGSLKAMSRLYRNPLKAALPEVALHGTDQSKVPWWSRRRKCRCLAFSTFSQKVFITQQSAMVKKGLVFNPRYSCYALSAFLFLGGLERCCNMVDVGVRREGSSQWW